MKQLNRIERERVFGSVPEVVERRMSYALKHLEEEAPMKKRTIPVLVLVLLLALVGIAYATVSSGLKWYYENRFNYGGMLPEDVQQRIQSDIFQSVNVENPFAHVVITGAAWMGEDVYQDRETLDIHIKATVKQPEKYEMVHVYAIDVDGARGEEERREHPQYGDRADEAWLWAYGSYGPLDQIMKEPDKELLLYGEWSENILWVEGAKGFPLSVASSDMYMDEETNEVIVNYNLRFTEEDIQTLRTYADAHGNITLGYESWAAPYWQYPDEPKGETGIITFSIKLP